ncbi:MAG: hypothetical protein ACI378_06685, partial [Bacteroides sp.]
PPAPKAGALTGLRYTPKASLVWKSGCKGKHYFRMNKSFGRKLQKNRKRRLMNRENTPIMVCSS